MSSVWFSVQRETVFFAAQLLTCRYSSLEKKNILKWTALKKTTNCLIGHGEINLTNTLLKKLLIYFSYH